MRIPARPNGWEQISLCLYGLSASGQYSLKKPAARAFRQEIRQTRVGLAQAGDIRGFPHPLLVKTQSV
jgi:hypothetical protein